MIAITLNLLAEEQLALQKRARDPFKMALAIGVGLITAAVGLGAFVGVLVNRKEIETDQLQAKFNAMGESVIAEQEVRYRWTESLSKDVVTLNTTRSLLAPQLALLKDLVPPVIQLQQLNLTVSALTSEPLMPIVAEEDDTKKPARPVRPTKVERLTLRMEGKAFGKRPELEVDKFLQTLRNDATFQLQVEEILLRSIARSEGGIVGAEIPIAAFVIECRYKDPAVILADTEKLKKEAAANKPVKAADTEAR